METQLLLSGSSTKIALVIIASEIITLKDRNPVLIGKEEKVINGTMVYLGNLIYQNSLTIGVYAQDSDKKSIKVGESFVDPVYKTFKLSFINTDKHNNKNYANILFETIPLNCTPHWILEQEWSICENDFQYKDWVNVNNCDNQSTKPNKINRSCEFINGNLTEKIEELEERIILLEHWKSLVSEWIDEVVVTLEEIFVFRDEVEEKLSVNQTINYFNYLSNSNRRNILCEYAEDNHLEYIEDLGLSCDLTYKLLRNGNERVTCKCNAV